MLRIKDAKITFFESKEQYLKFLAAWKIAANNPDETLCPRPEHYILYALLREKWENHGFTPITSIKKLDNGRRANEALFNARAHIIYKVEGAKIDLSLYKVDLDQLLEPFGETLSPEKLLLIGQALKQTKQSELIEISFGGEGQIDVVK